MSYVALNGGALDPGLSGSLSKIASLGESLVEDEQIKALGAAALSALDDNSGSNEAVIPA